MYPKSSTKLLSEIRSIVRLQTSLSRMMWLNDSDAEFELRLAEQKVLKARLDAFEKEMEQDCETEPYPTRRCQSTVLALKKLCSEPILLKAQSPRQNVRLAYTGHNAETSAKVVREEKQPPWQKICLVCTGHDDEASAAKVVSAEKPKSKRLLVSEELRMSRVSFAANELNEQQSLAPRWKGVFVLALMLMAAAVAATLFTWYRSAISSGDDPPTETYCESFDRLGCENGGYPVYTGQGFACKCADYYYGERCAHETFSSAVFRYIGALYDSANTDLRRGMPRMWWSFLPFTSDLQQTTIISFYQEQMKRLKNGFFSNGDGNVHRNVTMVSTRVLPPGRSLYCPSNNALPQLDTVYDEMFRRKPEDALKRDPKRRNMLYHTFYQYFVLQFFDARFNSMVTGSQLYGADESTRKELRSFSGGKLRTEQHSNGEHYPPRLSVDEKFNLAFSRMWSYGLTPWFDRVAADAKGPEDSGWDELTNYANARRRWAVGHPLSSMNPALFAMHTLWVREHNRVCDQLAGQWPEWTDDRLHDVAKRITVGEMMGIMMNDVLNVGGDVWPLKHDPGVHQRRVQVVDNFSTPIEMLLTMMMPSGLPEQFGNVNKADTMLFGDNSQVLRSGMGDTVRFMVGEPMGTMSNNNDGAATEPLTKALMRTSREHAVQGFNRYRTRLGLRAYKSFYELTGNQETAKKLESLYGTVGDVEMLTGMIAEKTGDGAAVPTFTVMVNSFIVNSIVSNPLYGETMWKPETFGGDHGFSVVKSASIRTLVCNNLRDECDDDEFIVNFYAK